MIVPSRIGSGRLRRAFARPAGNGADARVARHDDGSYALALDGFSLRATGPRVEVDGRVDSVVWRECAPGEWAGDGTAGRWRFSLKADGRRIVARLTGRLFAPATRVEATVLEVPEIAADHLVVQGERMGGCLMTRLPRAPDGPFESFLHGLVSRDGKTLMLSMPLGQRHPGSFRGESDGTRLRRLRARYGVEGFTGRDLDFEPVTLSAGDGFALLEEWSAEQPRRAAPVADDVGAGWNSWDYYRWTVTEDEVLENAEFIARDPVLSKHVKRIVVDDGWEYCYGEWEPNHRFPHGMAWLADRLTRMGFEPGLWFAPAIAEPQSLLAQHDHELLGRSAGGQPCIAFECMRRRAFALDPTVDRTRAWLRTLFDRYAGMGYKHFKLDFLYAVARPPHGADGAVPRGDRLRLLLGAIREGVAGRARILGCNHLFAAGAEFVDSVRVGADIHARRENIRGNAVAVAARHWAHGRFWRNDPDFALCRGPQTADDPDLERLRPLHVYIEPGDGFNAERDASLATASRTELEALLGLVLMSGGVVNLSDRLSRLNAEGLELARRIVSAPRGDAARPLDLFTGDRPEYWLQSVGRGKRFMAANWSDAPKTVSVPTAELGLSDTNLRDFWRDEAVSGAAGAATVEVPPHGCRILESF